MSGILYCWTTLQEAAALAAEKAAMEAPGISGGDILQLNVGGESFVVTRGTLTQVYCSTSISTRHALRLDYLTKWIIGA